MITLSTHKKIDKSLIAFLSFVLFIVVVILLLVTNGCNAPTEPDPGKKNVSSGKFTVPDMQVMTSDTGKVNTARYYEWTTGQRDSNYRVEFDGEVNSSFYSDNETKYLEITLYINNAVQFYYLQYNGNINGHHTFTVPDAFDKIIFYIKIFTNYSPNAFIRLTNITVTKY